MRHGNMKDTEYGYTDTLDGLVVSLCRDFPRREAAVREGRCTGRTAVEYKYINHKIKEGALEIAGERYARAFIDEIGRKRGYAVSDIDGMSESMYKLSKQSIKINIARKLHLID